MTELLIAVCEDDAEARAHLLDLIGSCDAITRCETFCTGEEFLAAFCPGKYDLIFMDIYMGQLSGVDTVAEVRRTDADVLIAFTTTSMDHTLEGYRLDVAKYLEKPVKQRSVERLLALACLKKGSRPHLTVFAEGRELLLPFDAILFAEQQAHILLLNMANGEVIRLSERLDVLVPQFAGQPFFRCHKSYLVNLAHIERLDRALMIFTMRGGKNVYIRRESFAAARKAYEDYLFEQARRQNDE